MRTECNAAPGVFQAVSGRAVVADFDGGSMTSDAGALLLGQADARVGLVDRLAACFEDHRDGRFVEHSVRTLVGQRVFGIALGYEDLIDHDVLRGDPVMAVLAGKLRAKRRTCAPVAGKSTLNRLELGGSSPSGDSKIVHDGSAIADVLVTLFLDAHEAAPDRVVLDFDATDDPVHGSQEGRFFHGYYDCYCYLPLYVLCGRHLLAARLRPANVDGAAGAVEEAARIVTLLRARWPDTRIVLRADSGFAREALMAWCEANGVDYLFGLARNDRLAAQVTDALAEAEADSERSGTPARRFADFMRFTRNSWSRERRVVAKAEWPHGKANPRFVIASLAAGAYDARSPDEASTASAARWRTASRTPTRPVRRWRLGARHARQPTPPAVHVDSPCAALRPAPSRPHRFAAATCGSLRLEPLEIAAWVRIGVRRIEIAMDTNHPSLDEFRTARKRSPAAAA